MQYTIESPAVAGDASADFFPIARAPGEPYLRVHCVTVFVRDQEQSRDFYLNTLGFSLVVDTQFEEFRWLAVAPPDGHTVLALLAPKPCADQGTLLGRATGVIFITDDLQAKFDEWSQRGVRFREPPRVERWGGTLAEFEDIDGNSFALVSVDIVSRELESQRRRRAERAEAERRLAHELDIARQVQARLFPQNLPSIRTLDYAGMCIQARHVGGDYYDFLNMADGRFGLVIGDISGKGVAAALLMANLQAILRGQCAVASEPQALLRSVNQLFCMSTAEAPMPPCSSRSTTTAHGACVTQTADISPRFCSDVTIPSRSWGPRARSSVFLKSGSATLPSANSGRATRSQSTPTVLPSHSARREKSLARSASRRRCSAIVNFRHTRYSRRLSTRSAGSVPPNSSTTSR
jgi:catechol 2,3-dioxygenase-like lactoylglutathione lyase family enzyme